MTLVKHMRSYGAAEAILARGGEGLEQVLALDEAARVLGVSPRTVRRRLKAGAYVAVPIGRAANGRFRRGILLASLPPEVRGLAGEEERAARGRTGRARPGPLEGIPLTREGLPDAEAMREAGLGKHVAEYERRVRAVSVLRSRLRDAGHGQKGARYERTAAEFGVGARTLRRWDRLLREGGFAALVPTWGLERKGRYRALPGELQRRILDAFAYGGRYSASQVYAWVVKPYFEDRGERVPHIRTIRRFLDDPRVLPPVVRTIAREGVRPYRERHEVRVRRRPEDVPPGAWWCSDHRLLDTLVLVGDGAGVGWVGREQNLPCPCGSERRRKECCSARRLWATVTVDVGSAAILGWRLSLQPNSSVVCHHLREAILRWGLPECWQRDRGREFTASRLTGPGLRLGSPGEHELEGAARWPAAMPPDVEQDTAWTVLGVRVVSSRPYSAWSKLIESFFSAFARQYENLMPGWTSGSADKRPEKLKREVAAGELLAVEEFSGVLSRMVAHWNSTPHGRREAPPLEILKARGVARPAPSREALDFLLQERGEACVRNGAIKLRGRVFCSEELAKWSGCRVAVRYDPSEALVYVYPPSGLPWEAKSIAVREVEPAAYGQWSEANKLARRASRAQRRFVREWAVAVKGTCPERGMDPFGAHREVRGRLERIAARKRNEQKLALQFLEAGGLAGEPEWGSGSGGPDGGDSCLEREAGRGGEDSPRLDRSGDRCGEHQGPSEAMAVIEAVCADLRALKRLEAAGDVDGSARRSCLWGLGARLREVGREGVWDALPEDVLALLQRYGLGPPGAQSAQASPSCST
jgi:transposase InsO family protein